MERTRHQLAPAVPGQKIDTVLLLVACPIAFSGRLEIADVQQPAGARRLGKARKQGLLSEPSCSRAASAVRLGLGRLDAAPVVSHVRRFTVLSETPMARQSHPGHPARVEAPSECVALGGRDPPCKGCLYSRRGLSRDLIICPS